MIYLIETVGSTNDLALEATDAQHGDMWVANQQTSGRGRREDGDRRTWHSPAGSGLYTSTVIKPTVEASDAAAITIAAGVAVCQTLQDYDVDVWLKWPNDIYVGRRKIAGILTEAATQYGMLDRIVIGIGINLSLQLDDVPPDLRSVLTSVAIETEQDVDRLDLVFAMHSRLIQIVDAYSRGGLESLSSFIARFDRSRGKQVILPDGTKGEAVGIANDGAFEATVDGAMRRVSAGEVKFVLEPES